MASTRRRSRPAAAVIPRSSDRHGDDNHRVLIRRCVLLEPSQHSEAAISASRRRAPAHMRSRSMAASARRHARGHQLRPLAGEVVSTPCRSVPFRDQDRESRGACQSEPIPVVIDRCLRLTPITETSSGRLGDFWHQPPRHHDIGMYLPARLFAASRMNPSVDAGIVVHRDHAWAWRCGRSCNADSASRVEHHALGIFNCFPSTPPKSSSSSTIRMRRTLGWPTHPRLADRRHRSAFRVAAGRVNEKCPSSACRRRRCAAVLFDEASVMARPRPVPPLWREDELSTC